MFEVWHNLAPFGSRPFSGTVEALLTRVFNPWYWQSPIVCFFVATAVSRWEYEKMLFFCELKRLLKLVSNNTPTVFFLGCSLLYLHTEQDSSFPSPACRALHWQSNGVALNSNFPGGYPGCCWGVTDSCDTETRPKLAPMLRGATLGEFSGDFWGKKSTVFPRNAPVALYVETSTSVLAQAPPLLPPSWSWHDQFLGGRKWWVTRKPLKFGLCRCVYRKSLIL